MKNWAVLLLLWLVAPLAIAQTIRLICTTETNTSNSRSGAKTDWVFVIDFDRQTLNEKPAFFGDDHVRQVNFINGENISTSINRITGSITIDSKGLGRIADGSCKVAGERKF